MMIDMIKKETLKKMVLSRPALLAVFILLALLLISAVTRNQSYRVIVKDRQDSFLQARSILIIGNRMLCIASRKIHKQRADALKDTMEEKSLSVVDMGNTALIELIHDEPDTGEKIPAIQGPVPAEYLGIYEINVAAHQGTLQLWSGGGRVYGSIRFPNWARGVAEPLKGVAIEGNNLRFTRSVTNREEQTRVGSSTYFTQGYFGVYHNGGRLIKGYYTREGHRGLWEGVKKK
jgi:hypothetical protein